MAGARLRWAAHTSDELVLSSGDAFWPRGFSGRLLDGEAELIAADGTVVARAGNHLEGLGGFGDGPLHVCSIRAAGLEWGPWGVRTLTPASPAPSG